MKYVLILMLFATVACSKEGSQNGNAFGTVGPNSTDSAALSGSYFRLNGDSTSYNPSGTQFSFANGYVTMTEIRQVAINQAGVKVPQVSTYQGTYIKDGRNILMTYTSPLCMKGQTEVIEIIDQKDGKITFARRMWPEAFEFSPGDFANAAITSQAIFTTNCYTLTQNKSSDRKPASVKNSTKSVNK